MAECLYYNHQPERVKTLSNVQPHGGRFSEGRLPGADGRDTETWGPFDPVDLPLQMGPKETRWVPGKNKCTRVDTRVLCTRVKQERTQVSTGDFRFDDTVETPVGHRKFCCGRMGDGPTSTICHCRKGTDAWFSIIRIPPHSYTNAHGQTHVERQRLPLLSSSSGPALT